MILTSKLILIGRCSVRSETEDILLKTEEERFTMAHVGLVRIVI